MTNKALENLRESQLTFIGRTLAGVAHEFKNHLAVINELSGLLGDLLQAEISTESDNQERFATIVRTIEERVALASVRASHLNRFAHRMDEPVASFSVNEAIEEILSLLNWRVKQKKIILLTDLDENLPAVISNPSLVQFVVFWVLRPGLEQLEENDKLLLSVRSAEKAVCVKVCYERTEMPANIDLENHFSADVFLGVLEELNCEFCLDFDEKGRQQAVLKINSVQA